MGFIMRKAQLLIDSYLWTVNPQVPRSSRGGGAI